MSTPYRRDLERLRYWQGQALRSVDARDQARFDALRRQLHNRALHEAGGVAFGLAVRPDGADMSRIEVACGLAYDARGRELVLQRTRAIGVSPRPGWLVLRIKPVDRAAACCPPSDPGCRSDSSSLLEANVELAWVERSAFEPADGVVLARFDGGHLDAGFFAHRVRPLARPRLARGESVRGDTPWEPWVIERPDGNGGIVAQVVGVQTHIDTSASGFTKPPRYVAGLQAQAWDLATAEFAPAFFPHVAEPTIDGFTFRLLMAETARRRYAAWFGSARVASTTRGVGDRLIVEVDAAASFKQGGPVAQLRPRASSAVRIEPVDDATPTLRLAAPLAGPVAVGTMLAVGNLPRSASVVEVLPDDPGVVAEYTALAPVRRGDVLQRTADGALAVIDRAAQGRLTVDAPFADWQVGDALQVARLAGGADVRSAALSADGASLTLELRPVAHGVEVGMAIVLLDGDRRPLATTPKVTRRSGALVAVQPLPSAAEIAAIARVAPLAAGIVVQSLAPKVRGTVGVDPVGPFAVGDFVAVAGDTGRIALVERVDAGAARLELSTTLAVAVGATIVAADWQGATTVAGYDPKHPDEVVVGRVAAVAPGDFVALRAANDFATPVAVAAVAGTLVKLAAALVGVVRLDTLAIGRFPGLATVVAQQPEDERLVLAEPDAFVAGACVTVLPAAAEGPVVQVVSVQGTQVVLSASLGRLVPGVRLATVHWRDRVVVKSTSAAHPERIGVDVDPGFRESDVVGVLAHYADCSNPGYVEKVDGATLTLALPGIEHGDGIVDRGWIDGGLVGPAAVSDPAPAPRSFPSSWQPLVRMAAIDGIDGRAAATAYGLDLLTGTYQSRAVQPLVIDAAGAHLLLFGAAPGAAYRMRPETLSLITRFNTDFPRAFATFAQKQQLVVRWIGCQEEFPPAGGCPGSQPYDPCASAATGAVED